MVSIELTTRIAAPQQRCFDLARSIDLHLVSTGKSREQAVGGRTAGLIALGEWVRWSAIHFGVRQQLSSRITSFDAPSHFRDEMVEGAFRFLKHDHWFRTVADGCTEMRDDLLFAAPLPMLGLVAEKLVLARYMRGFLRERNQVLKRVAESDRWKEFVPGPKLESAAELPFGSR